MPLRVRVQPNVLSLTRVQAVRHYIRRLLLDHRAREVKDIVRVCACTFIVVLRGVQVEDVLH